MLLLSKNRHMFLVEGGRNTSILAAGEMEERYVIPRYSPASLYMTITGTKACKQIYIYIDRYGYNHFHSSTKSD